MNNTTTNVRTSKNNTTESKFDIFTGTPKYDKFSQEDKETTIEEDN